MVREQVHAVGRARALVRGAARRAPRGRRADVASRRPPRRARRRSSSSVSSDACRSRASSPLRRRRPSLVADRLAPSAPDRRPRSAAPVRVDRRPAPQRARSPPRTSARSKKRRPRTWYATPARVSASSIGASCAFIRTRTAISARRDRPPRAAPRIRVDERGQLRAPPSGALGSSGSGPSPRVATSRFVRPSAASSRFASSRTCGRRAVVLGRADDLVAPGPALGERRSGTSRRGAGERVDRLVLVADDAQVARLAEPQLEQPLLERVRVLVLVDAEPALARADRRGRLRVGLEQVDGLDQQVVEVDPARPAPWPARSPAKTRTNRSTGIGGSRPAAAAAAPRTSPAVIRRAFAHSISSARSFAGVNR